ncbi:MAG TPA: HD domain-containing phosphohydrolase [Candidatus Solibacter sp.]|nr:HD domain-containing phosphohydrolase [Candidatus Solibacter sp.]
MSEKILLVDDEPNVLQACERLLHDKFVMETAVGGAAAVTAIKTKGPYAVVMSDLRMPQMDGLELLAIVKKQAPDTVRIMLTGYADVQTALLAINEGNIFRFLTKPCGKQTLVKALTAGLAQYQLVTSEKEILEKTLAGSIGVLSDVLSVASPAAFSRALRLRRYLSHISTRMQLANRWKFELAALLSQLGCVTIPPETIDAVYAGQPLPPKEQKLYDSHPQIAFDLLKNIPRLANIAAMIAHQNDADGMTGNISDRDFTETRLGAQLLAAAMEFDARIVRGASRSEAASLVGRHHTDLDPRVMVALIEVEPEARDKIVQRRKLEEIAPGTVAAEDVRTETGTLIIAKHQEVTSAAILKLKNYCERGAIAGDLAVSVPAPPAPDKAEKETEDEAVIK